MDNDKLAQQIANACSTFGFFQVTNHGISDKLIEDFRHECRLYFRGLDRDTKLQWKRNAGNARGYFDDELTKQRRDWKECLDVGVPYSRDWTLEDEDNRNECLDGWNQFPPTDVLPDFRNVVVRYFDACAKLSHRLAILMARGFGKDADDALIRDLEKHHTSYLRTNFYPPCQSEEVPAPLGISPHKDAGFLTVLLQDDDCHSLQVWNNQEWTTVHPLRNALTINTGDMAQVWSNGKYKAPLHRVLTDPYSDRYSAPFFYNPGYETWVRPALAKEQEETAKYNAILWGYFRAVRFAGDLTDLGVEIQINDFETSRPTESPHSAKQRIFANDQGWPSRAFNVERYRDLLLHGKEVDSQL